MEHRSSAEARWLGRGVLALTASAFLGGIGYCLAIHADGAARKPRADVGAAARVEALELALARTNRSLQRLSTQNALATALAERASPEAEPAPLAEAANPLLSEEERAAARAEAAKAKDERDRQPFPEEREKAYFEAYFAELEVAMAGQPADAELAQKLAAQMPGRDSGLIDVVELTCSETMCRMAARYHHADRGARDRFVDELLSAFASDLDQATIHLPTDDNTLRGYFSRHGARLPKPTTSYASFMRGEG